MCLLKWIIYHSQAHRHIEQANFSERRHIMFIPYPDTTKELNFDTDYIRIRDMINTFKLSDIPGIIDNVEAALENAFINHSELLENALYMDIAALKKWYIVRMISCSSSGTIASYINNTTYRQIDRAVNNTLLYLFEKATEEELYNLSIDPEGIKNVVFTHWKDDIQV